MEKQIEEQYQDLQECIEYDEWYAREFGETYVDCDITARNLINKGYTKQEWISVEDRLPDENVRVLVALKTDKNYTDIDTDRISNKYSYKWVRWGTDVTHWMPLPQPPKMKGESK